MDLWDRSVPERITSSKDNKLRGTEALKEGDTTAAGEWYIKALRDLIPIIDVPEEHKDEVLSLTLTCRANLALCQLKLKQYSKVVKNCCVVLDKEPDNVKCLYRRGCAYYELNELESSLSDLEKALQIEPDNTAVLCQKRKLKEKFNVQSRKDAELMKQYLKSAGT